MQTSIAQAVVPEPLNSQIHTNTLKISISIFWVEPGGDAMRICLTEVCPNAYHP
jgi:hypothetical protein